MGRSNLRSRADSAPSRAREERLPMIAVAFRCGAVEAALPAVDHHALQHLAARADARIPCRPNAVAVRARRPRALASARRNGACRAPPAPNARSPRPPVFGPPLRFGRVSGAAGLCPLRQPVTCARPRWSAPCGRGSHCARRACASPRICGDFGAQSRTCLRRRSGVDGFGGSRRGAASASNRFSPRLTPRSGRPGIARSGPRFSGGAPIRVRGRSPDPPFGGGSMAMVSGASKSTFASLASFTPSWSRSTRVRTSMTSASGRSPSSNGPNETRISRLTARPRCSRIFLISRFFPSLRPKVSQAFAPCSRSSLASTPR